MHGPAERLGATEDGSYSVSVGKPLMVFEPRKDKKWRGSKKSVKQYF